MSQEIAENKIKQPLMAIKMKCLDCCCYQENEVKLCTAHECPLYNFRMGKNPFHKQNLTEEERRRRSEAMKLRMANKRQEKELGI